MGLIDVKEIITMANKVMRVCKAQQYESGGEEKTSYTQVATAVPHSKGGGFTIHIPKGVLVTGELLVFPPSDGTESD